MNGWKEAHCIYQLMNHHQGFAFLLYNNCLIFSYSMSQVIASITFLIIFTKNTHTCKKKTPLEINKSVHIGILGRIQTVRFKEPQTYYRA